MNSQTFSIPIRIIPIEDDGYHLTMEVEIDHRPALLLIDTGASRSVFDSSRIRNFIGDQAFEPHDKLSTGLGTNSMLTQTTTLKKIKIGDLIIFEFQAVLLDLSHVNDSYSKLGIEPIDGVIGSDLLYQFRAVIDYAKSEIQLTKRNISEESSS